MKERNAGVVALTLSAVVVVATLVHAVQTITLIASGQVVDTALAVRDGVAIYTQYASVDGVSPQTVIAGLVSDATILGVLALVTVIGVALVRGRPFGPGMPAAVAITGVLIAVGGTVTGAVGSFAEHRADAGESVPAPLQVPIGFTTVSLLPLAAGLTIVLLAFVFRSGVRLQRDSDGLV